MCALERNKKMKIIIVLATGALITFTADKRTNPDCFSRGYEVLQKIATYHESGTNQGWYTKENKLIYGFYCE